MPLFNKLTNSHAFSEDYMQGEVVKYLLQSDMMIDFNKNILVSPKVVREFKIPECKRISDIIVHFSPRKIFNIECKLSDVNGVIKQAISHLSWADYSLVCLPHNTYISNMYRTKMIKEGIGLLLWVNNGNIVEAIYPKHNKEKDNKIRKKIYKRLKKHL